MVKLCLNMIVKDEAAIIEETIRNVCQKIPISYWIISDTGSTDNTKEIILKTFKSLDIEGELYSDEWKNFAYNRNLALERCIGKTDYAFIFDADDRIECEGTVIEPDQLIADAYYFNLISEDRTVHYQRILLVKPEKAKYRGVVHEYLELDSNATISYIRGEYNVLSRRQGSRSKDKDKYIKDAKLLEQALLNHQDPDLTSRYLFYCAQSYQDAGQIDQAITYYKKRIEHEGPGWEEERYMSCLRMGMFMEERREIASALYYFTIATEINPNRAEAWYQLARFNNWNGNHQVAFLYSKEAVKKVISEENLFVQYDIYTYWAQYELFINAYNIGEYLVAYKAFKQLVYGDTPLYLYQNEKEKVSHFKPFLKEETYGEIQQLSQRLREVSCHELAEVLGI